MDFDKLDPDFFVRAGAYTAHVFRDVYPAIDPSSPTLSQAGKVVIITGATGGIGAGLITAFAKAGAKALVLVGRSQQKLKERSELIKKDYPGVEVLSVPADIVTQDDVNAVYETIRNHFGKADILVNNAGSLGSPSPAAQSSVQPWWQNFEINVKGTFLMTKGFLNLLGPDGKGIIINTSSGAATNVVPGLSSYGISKLAVNRLTEFIAAENPGVVSITLDPGTVDTDMVMDAFRKFAKDTPELVGGFTVWLTTEQAAFLNGRVVAANWSVDDLVAKKEEILAGSDLKVVLQGQFGIN